MTLGAAAAQVRLIVWCKACQHQVEPDPGDASAKGMDIARCFGHASHTPQRRPTVNATFKSSLLNAPSLPLS
jgi:hypothetical protein